MLNRRDFIKTTSLAAMGLVLAGCGGGEKSAATGGGDKADLVVYGKIFTSEDNKIVEAFAVKDGKFVYVGDKAGAEPFIEKGKTEVIDYSGKGLVMPGCGNGHAHYSAGHAIQAVGTVFDKSYPLEKLFAESIPAAVKKAREVNAKTIFGSGWDRNFPPDFPYRQRLDAICSDIPIYFADEEGHKGMANTLALVNAGIMSKDGTTFKKEMRGGVIAIGADGTPTGYLSEQAGTFVRSFLDNEYLFSVDVVKGFMPKIEQQLHSEGYTMYLDGWGNYFYNESYFKAANQMDKAGDLHLMLGLSYELESWMDIDKNLEKSLEVQKYASEHVKTNWVKLFMDGTVETGTGFIEPLYRDGHQGIANWEEDEVTYITRKSNAKGLSMHIHTMGNKAVNRVVNAFVNGGKDEMRNTLVHVYSVMPSDYKRMADHNIYVTEGMLWHHNSDDVRDYLMERLPGDMGEEGFPMKSYFDNGVVMSSHSDFPALTGSPDDPFGIIEVAVTGQWYLETGKPRWPEELITREQALTALTINVARQMFIEQERGSISVGKYADFLLVNKDVLTCPVTDIHNAKPAATYFEGQKVFAM